MTGEGPILLHFPRAVNTPLPESTVNCGAAFWTDLAPPGRVLSAADATGIPRWKSRGFLMPKTFTLNMAPDTGSLRLPFTLRQAQSLGLFPPKTGAKHDRSRPHFKVTTTTNGRGRRRFTYWRKMAARRFVRLLAFGSQQIKPPRRQTIDRLSGFVT